MKKIGVYIHIPFCRKKCIYCDFVSFANRNNFQEKYFEALKKEIQNFDFQEYKIDTIYIGGGTPSYVDSKYIKEVLEILKNKIDEDAEITIELNPGTVNEEKLKVYKEMGINRLSIGLQSTKNHLLKELGRIHSFEEFLETYKLAKEQGFDNINVDLMIGLPNQRIEDIKESLEKIIEIEPKHISVYSLIVEEKTIMEQKIQNNELELPEEELERNMYWYVKNFLELNNYKHYEISNFAKEGYESKHNTNCWKQHEYIGFGLAAQSYVNRKRFGNLNNFEEYIEAPEDSIEIHEIQTKEDEMKEYMLLGLRMLDGVSIQKFENKFNENPIMLFREELNKLTQDELIIIDGDNIKLTNRGIDLANLVWEKFI